MGSTLTLKQTDANILLSSLAFFIVIVASHIWRIACYALHSRYSTRNSQDALHHQRQAILRNNSNAAASILTFIHLAWEWRKLTRAYWRMLPLMTFTLTMALALEAASVFSSRVAMGNEVLLLSIMQVLI